MATQSTWLCFPPDPFDARSVDHSKELVGRILSISLDVVVPRGEQWHVPFSRSLSVDVQVDINENLMSELEQDLQLMALSNFQGQ